ncbi:MAG TPA: hypothetical protein VF901_17990, partial [Bradyrhizobium sp.]
ERRDISGTKLVDDGARGGADQILRQLIYSYAYSVVIASAVKRSRNVPAVVVWIASLRSQ